MSGPHAPGSGRVYEPVAEIARGGMGHVELVVRREGSFARVYALKRLHEELAGDADVRAMFLEEARIAGLIRHPNVVPVLDVGEDDYGPYLVMEFVESVAASALLTDAKKTGQPLSLGLCAEIARQAAHGLAAAHELEGAGGKLLSVVHRDISPQNLLLGFDGLVRVTDFGVARALDRRADRSAALIGKVGYVSPEQVAGQPLDPRSDLFSLGIVVHELLTAQRLYGGDRFQVFERIRREPAPDVRTLRPDVPAALAELVAQLLAKTPDERPATAALVASRLELVVAALRDAGEEVTLAPFLRATFAEEWQRQRRLVASALERTVAVASPFDRAPAAGGAAGAVGPGAAGGTDTVDAVEAGAAALQPRKLAVDDAASTKRLPDTSASAPAPSPGPGAGTVRAATIAGIVVVLALALWAALEGRRGEDSDFDASGPSAVIDHCTDSAACRAARGPAAYCDATTRRCAAVVSPVCPELSPPQLRNARTAIVLGTIFDRTTPNQRARERAARLAVAGLDQVGGIDGREVVLVHCDSAVSGARAAADQLVRAGIPAIVGPSTSAETEAVFAAHAADGVLFVSPSATATQLGEVDGHVPGLLWRTAPPDGLQAAVVVDDLQALPRPARSLGLVRRSNDVYAQSLSVLVQEAAGGAGLVVASSALFADRDGLGAAAASAIAPSPDAIVVLSSRVADAAGFLDAAAALPAYDGVPIYFADAAANDDLVAQTTTGARLLPDVRATRPAPPSTLITSEFALEYRAANGGEDPLQFSFTAHTYDAMELVLLGTGYALRDGGALTGTRIAAGIRLVSAGTREHRLLGANLPATIAALRAPTPDVNVLGASGPLDYDARTEELTSATYQVLGVRGDPPRFEVLRTVDASP